MMATSARAYNAGNVMLMRSESTSTDTLVAMLASCGASSMQGVRSVGGLEEAVMGSQKRQYYPMFDTSEEIGDDDAADDCSHHVEKKRRLTVDQVKSLEKNFELENKLEPERKMQLARELGLQPRQVAVWFQNRRARWKTKQLERDYDVLKLDFDTLKSDYDSVVENNKNLKAEILRLSKLEAQLKHRNLDAQLFGTDALDVASDLGPHLEMASKSDIGGGVHHEEEYEIEPNTAALVANMNLESPVKSKGGGSTSSESNSSEIMNADSPHPIDSGVSPSAEQKSATFLSSHGLGSTTDATAINVELSLEDLCGGRLAQRIPATTVKVEDVREVAGALLQEDNHAYNFYNTVIDENASLHWWGEWPC